MPTSEGVGALTAHVGNYNVVVGELVNVSSDWITVGTFDVSLYGSNGKLLHRYRHDTSAVTSHPWVRVPPGARAPFSISLTSSADSLLAKTTRVVVVPYPSVENAGKRVNLTSSDAHRTAHHRQAFTWYDYSAEVHNPLKWMLLNVTAFVEARDRRGVLVGLATVELRLPAHSTRKFSTTYDNWHTGETLSVRRFRPLTRTDGLLPGVAVQVDLHGALDQAGRLLQHNTVLHPGDTVIAPLSAPLLPGWDEDWP